MSDNKLFVPIQINGELSKATNIKTLTLLERELYIDNEGNLYYGNVGGSPLKVKAKSAEISDVATNVGNSGSFVQVTQSAQEMFAGILHILNDSSDTVLKKRSGNSGSVKLEGLIFDSGVVNASNITDLKYVTLNSNMWGTNLPTSDLVDGRLFFQVSE